MVLLAFGNDPHPVGQAVAGGGADRVGVALAWPTGSAPVRAAVAVSTAAERAKRVVVMSVSS